MKPVHLPTCERHIPVHLTGIVRAVPAGPGSFLSPAATPDSAGQCGSVFASPNEAARSVNTPLPQEPSSAAVLLSCPTRESPWQKKQKEQQNIKTFYSPLANTHTLYTTLYILTQNDIFTSNSTPIHKDQNKNFEQSRYFIFAADIIQIFQP